MIATPANLTPPAVDPDLVAAVARLAAWAGRPCTAAEAADALRDVLAGSPDQSRVPAGQPGGGQFGEGGGGGPGQAGQAVAGKEKFVGAKVGKAEHVHAYRVEASVAKALDGAQLDDNEPLDVRVKDGAAEHAVEVKSLLKGGKQALSVHDDALLRKVDYAAANPDSTFHTVAVDERAAYGGGAHKENYSGNRLYYKRGSGRYALSKMEPARDEAHLRELMRTPDHLLPERARGALPKGDAVKKLRESAEKAHEARLAKDRARKARIREARDAARGEGAAATSAAAARPGLTAFNPDQPRDDHGRFGEGGGGGSSDAPAAGKGGLLDRLKRAVGIKGPESGGTGAGGKPVPHHPKEFAHAVNSSTARQAFRGKVVAAKAKVYEAAARDVGMTREQLEKDVKDKAQALVNKQDVYVRVTPDTLGKILGDGRLKNVAEIPTVPKPFRDVRAKLEHEGMGVAHSVAADQRPISGYLGEPGFAGTRGEPAGEDHFGYGKVVVRLKEDVKDRSTVTFDDSGAALKVGRMVASPLRDVDPYSVSSDHVRAHGAGVLKDLRTYQGTTKLYVETQTHGGVKTSDIHEVGFHEAPDKATQDKLAAHGIAWRVY